MVEPHEETQGWAARGLTAKDPLHYQGLLPASAVNLDLEGFTTANVHPSPMGTLNVKCLGLEGSCYSARQELCELPHLFETLHAGVNGKENRLL